MFDCQINLQANCYFSLQSFQNVLFILFFKIAPINVIRVCLITVKCFWFQLYHTYCTFYPSYRFVQFDIRYDRYHHDKSSQSSAVSIACIVVVFTNLERNIIESLIKLFYCNRFVCVYIVCGMERQIVIQIKKKGANFCLHYLSYQLISGPTWQ